MIALRFYRIYDIGREIDLCWLESALARNYFTARTSFVRVKQKSIMMEEPPLVIQMNPVSLERDGRTYRFSAVAKVFDIGAISLCFIYESPDGDYQELEELGFVFSGGDVLSDIFVQYLRILGEIVKPHIRNFAVDPDFFEDYSIYIMDCRDDTIDPVPLLIGERVTVSPETRKELVKNSLSYTMSDLAILSWDSALVCTPDSPADVIDLIEYASVQVLELRYYDRELTRMMEKMYDDVGSADRPSSFQRSRQYQAIMTKQMETAAEISAITEKLDNLIKVTEDVYYARVYETALSVLRGRQWNASVNRKISMIQENYAMLSDEVRNQHSNFLEWIIITLIALEFRFALFQFVIYHSAK